MRKSADTIVQWIVDWWGGRKTPGIIDVVAEERTNDFEHRIITDRTDLLRRGLTYCVDKSGLV